MRLPSAGLLPDGGKSLLSGPIGQLVPALRQFAHGLVRDAVHHGWLRHLHHDQRTAEGEQAPPGVVSVGEQVAEVGVWLGQETAPGADEVEFFPPGGADAPVTQFQDAGAGGGGDDG
jgi:hypothetical protein